ncbi:NAD-dependent epimerase/dehydratase family protein, partial [Devosia sp.]|uniref:NAD-dependent epimerase/dehydratase family protein n=1 Tax=Devosia sp. TaxID=1871048 RepID=UPI002FCB850B
MRIVVVGGNGFIGSHFVAAAVRAGHEITVSGSNPQPRYPHGLPFRFLPGGLDALAEAGDVLAGADAICHFASNSIPSSSNADPLGDIEGNLRPTVRLLEALRRIGGKRIVYLSSGGAIYGRPQTTPMREDHPTNPMSSYGIVKLAVEKYLALYSDQDGHRTTVIRPANPYGPGQGTFG